MVRFKVGVKLDGLQPQMLVALTVAEELFQSITSCDTVVTSANDGEHKQDSWHYRGRALDFRTKHTGSRGKAVASEMRKLLGPLGFDVIFEGENTENEHIHCEYDPK